MHDRQHDDFRWKRRIYETVGKSAQTITPRAVPEELPSLRVLLDTNQTLADCQSELRAKPRQQPIIVSHRVGQFGLGFRQEPDRHGLRCLASTASASRAVASPLR